MCLPDWIKATRRIVAVQPSGLSTSPAAKAEPSGTPRQRKELSFKMECQRATQWCWAAVAVSVARFYQPASPWDQCSLANAVLTQTNCCDGTDDCLSSDRPRLCDDTHDVKSPLDTVGHLHDELNRSIGLAAAPGAVTVQGELDGGRPVVCLIKPLKAPGHFVVLHGYLLDGTTELVLLADPANGRSVYTLPSLDSGYKGGTATWTYTYTTQP